MALNCFTPDEFDALNIEDMQIAFLSQTYFGDEIKIYKKQNTATNCVSKEDKFLFKTIVIFIVIKGYVLFLTAKT